MPGQYTVPQFIDIEDKVLGPVTVRQFVVVIVGVGIIVADYSLFYKALGQTIIFFLIGALTLAGVIAFAFLKINGRPFHLFLLNVLQSMRNPSLRVWDNRVTDTRAAELPPAPTAVMPHKAAPSGNRLAKIALLVDTGGVYNEDQEVSWDDSGLTKPPPSDTGLSPR